MSPAGLLLAFAVLAVLFAVAVHVFQAAWDGFHPGHAFAAAFTAGAACTAAVTVWLAVWS